MRGTEKKALLFEVIWKQIDTKASSKQQDFFGAFINELFFFFLILKHTSQCQNGQKKDV